MALHTPKNRRFYAFMPQQYQPKEPNWQNQRRFGNRSLGSLLHAYPHLRRSDFELAFAAAPLLHVPAAVYTGDATLWGRRSRIVLKHQPLLVSDICLPGFDA